MSLKSTVAGRAGMAVAGAVLMTLLAVSRSTGQQYDSKIQEQEAELNRLKQEIADQKKQAASLKEKERDEVKRLHRIDARLEDVSRQLSRLRRDEAEVSSAIRTTDRDLRKTERELAVLRSAFGSRLREMYKRTVHRDAEWLLAADSFRYFLRNLTYLNRIARRNRDRYRTIMSHTRRLASSKDALESEFAEKQRIKREHEALKKRHRTELAERQRILDTIKGKRSYYEQAARESEERYRQVQEFIDRLERQRNSGGAVFDTRFARNRGSLMWPVSGTVVKKYGKHKHPRYGTVTFNKGIDIRTKPGQNVRAVWKGKAAVVNWIRGYGKFVVLDHGEGYYTLYAHLDDVLISQGETLARGEVIGTAGGTGSLQGSALHFEIRKGREVVNPLPWLAK